MNIKEHLNLKAKNINLWKRTLILICSVIPWWTTVWITLLIVQGLIPGATVYLSKLSIESIIATRADLTNLNNTFLILALTGASLVVAEVFNFLIGWVKTIQSDILTDHLKNLIHQKAAEVDIEFYDSPAYFDLLEQARGNAISKPLVLLEGFGSVLQSTITLLTFTALLVSYGWWIPFVLFFGALPVLYIHSRSERLFYEWSKRTTTARRWLSHFDIVLTIRYAAAEVRVFNLSEYFQKKFQNLSLLIRTEKIAILKRQFIGRLLASILALITAGIGLGWITLKVIYNTASLGDLAVFYQIFSRGQSLVKSLIGGINSTFSSSLYLEHLFEFLDLQPKIVSPQNPVPFPSQLQHGIRFSNVTFSYPGEKQNVFERFNLFIPAGKTAAIVGVNGAGKSTLIKLLCRFYDPAEGAVEIDGIDIRKFDIKELQRNLSLHFQFPFKYSETAAQNIAFGDIERKAGINGIQKAAMLAGAHDFISKLPKKYETLCGKDFEEGCELSGGQWQRLLLAKAYFRKAPILILDEPTSYIDPWAENEWFENLKELVANQIGFIVTHRFTIAMRADIIYVVNEGKIIESGSHNELLKINGFYAESWNSQMQITRENLPHPENNSKAGTNSLIELV